MKTQKEIIELMSEKVASTKLAVLPGPLTQEDVRDVMSTMNRTTTGLATLAKANKDTELTKKVADIEKLVAKLKDITSKLPKRQ